MPKKSSMSKISDAIAKAFPERSGLASEGSLSQVREVIPVLEVVDSWLLGCGGLPVGRFGEVFGDKGAGKTSFGFACLAGAQKAGGVGVLVETERSLDISRASVFGLNPDELFLVEPDTIEEVVAGLEQILSAVPKRCGPNVLVWDSLAATEVGKGGHQPGRKAALLAAALPKLVRLTRDRRFAVVVVNQLRNKIGVLFGPSDTTPGGNAMKFHCSYRLQLWAGAAVKKGKHPIGIDTTIKAVHNKVGIPFHKAKVRLLFDSGFQSDRAVLDLGRDLGIVTESAYLSADNLAKIRAVLSGSSEPS